MARIKLDFDLTTGEHDAWLLAKLSEASEAIATHCNRAFGRTVVNEQFRLRADRDSLILTGYPVASIATVMDGDEELDEYEWEADYRTGLLYRLDGYGNRSCWIAGEVVVTYTYGWVLPGESGRDLPADIESAVLIQIKGDWFSRKRDPMVKEVEVPDVIRRAYWVDSIGTTSSALHPEVIAKLSKYVVRRRG